jgi:predicted anti-sigma-YlaC factor YlaD
VARLGLLLVSGAQLMLAVPALLGRDPGASVHIAHEQGSWAMALAVGLLVVALRPARAAAMLPLVAALAAGLALTMTLDIWAGRTQAATEAPHGLAFLGLGLLWLLTRDARYGRYARAPHTRTGTARPA